MKLEAPDIGSFLHLVISRFSEELEAGNLKVTAVNPNLKELVLTLTWDPKRSPLVIYTMRSK